MCQICNVCNTYDLLLVFCSKVTMTVLPLSWHQVYVPVPCFLSTSHVFVVVLASIISMPQGPQSGLE